MSKKALLLVNHRSRKGKEQFKIAVDSLHELDFELVIIPSKKAEEIPEIITEYASKIDLVIIGGGDGTLNLAVDSLVTHNLPLGIIPMGTANDLARTLGLPLGIKEACQVIAQNYLNYIDLGWVNDKHFFNVASLGLSVKITENLSAQAKSRWGILAYVITALKVIRNSKPFRAEIIIGDVSIKVKTVQIAIGNGCYYGGGMAVSKDATINDQRLDLYSLELKNRWQVFPLIWTLPRGGHDILPWVRSLKVNPSQTITIKTSKPFTINTDGELTVTTPATFKVIPRALGVFVTKQ